MDRKILITSSSRADRYLLEPLADKLGTELLSISANAFWTRWMGYQLCVLLGDRIETLELAINSVGYGIPIAHIHGGEVTAGSKDEMYRHAITKLSHIHLTSHQDFADRVIRMGENPKDVFVTGSLGVWRAKNFKAKLPLPNRHIVAIYHPNTIEPDTTESEIICLIDALKSFNEHRIDFFLPNHDSGHEIIERKIMAFSEIYPNVNCIEEESGDKFLARLKSADCIVGNSSCGIIEAPSLRTPTVNIGNRQDGRPRARSILNTPFNSITINGLINAIIHKYWVGYFDNPYDNVKTDTVDMMCDILKNHPVSFQKRFYD